MGVVERQIVAEGRGRADRRLTQRARNLQLLRAVLHQLGHDLAEKRPLGAWMRELHPLLLTEAKVVPAAKELAELVGEDALGLPVTWLRLHVNETLDDTTMAEAMGLPLDTEVDRGQWAAWIFRELSLDLALAEAAEDPAL